MRLYFVDFSISFIFHFLRLRFWFISNFRMPLALCNFYLSGKCRPSFGNNLSRKQHRKRYLVTVSKMCFSKLILKYLPVWCVMGIYQFNAYSMFQLLLLTKLSFQKGKVLKEHVYNSVLLVCRGIWRTSGADWSIWCPVSIFSVQYFTGRVIFRSC